MFFFFAVPTPVRLLGLGNSQCLFRAIAKLSRYDGILFLCGASASTPILSNFAVYHIGINSYRKPSLDRCSLWKKLRIYTQPAINLGAMLKHQMRV